MCLKRLRKSSATIPNSFQEADLLFEVIVRKSIENDTSIEEERDSIYADFNMYTSMAHFVGKVLHIRPNEILDTWNVAELLVAYGEYGNQLADRNFEMWKSGDRKTASPPRYIVKFIGVKEMQDG